MPDANLTRITEALDRFLDEGATDALDLACRIAAQGSFDIAALLAWLEAAPADDAPKDLATRRIRAAIGLPPMPGAACRPVAFGPDGRVVKR
jgi:hypothetical protein